MEFPERLIYKRFTKIDHRDFHEVAFTMKRIALLVVSILLFSFLAPLACAEKLDDSVLLSYYDDCVLFGDSRMEALKRYCSAVRQSDESFLRKTTITYSEIKAFIGGREDVISVSNSPMQRQSY